MIKALEFQRLQQMKQQYSTVKFPMTKEVLCDICNKEMGNAAMYRDVDGRVAHCHCYKKDSAAGHK